MSTIGEKNENSKMSEKNENTMISIDRKVLELWHNKLCTTEIKIINSVNLMSVIHEIEFFLVNSNQNMQNNKTLGE